MPKKRLGIGTVVALSIVFALSLPAAADEFLDLRPLIGNVTGTSPGSEVIAPYFRCNDANSDDICESVTVWYNIYKNNSTIKLYNSTPKTCSYPAVTCTAPFDIDQDDSPKFIRTGKWMVTGMSLQTECESYAGDGEAYYTFIYMADVSKAAGVVRTLFIKNAEMNSMELSDYNSDGIADLDLIRK